MKRFWLVMLSLGMVLAFSASAMAVDVKFSGDFTIGGMYIDKTTVKKDTSSDGPSTAFYYQRLRVKTDFVVAPGLSFVTRADVMSRVWGGARSSNTTNEPLVGSSVITRPGSAYESENIVFDWAYINYVSPIGLFMVGYQNDNAWGTTFGDSATPAPGIQYILPVGQFTLIAKITKGNDWSKTSTSPAGTGTNADLDEDVYTLAGIYNFKDGSAGLLGRYYRLADYPVGTGTTGRNFNSLTTVYLLAPYAKAKIGPVAIQAEFNYLFGRITKEGPGMNWFGEGALNDIQLSSMSLYIDAVADFNKFYAGGSLAYISGDDPGTADKMEGVFLNGGNDWSPCLFMFNNDRAYWAGTVNGYGANGANGPMGGNGTAAGISQQAGAWFAQGRVGVRPVAALDIMASLSFATADKKPTAAWVGNAYGYELDVTGTYKITNNLSYMLGVGYLFTGEFYKGTNSAASLRDDYMLINKLTLTF